MFGADSDEHVSYAVCADSSASHFLCFEFSDDMLSTAAILQPSSLSYLRQELLPRLDEARRLQHHAVLLGMLWMVQEELHVLK